MQMTFTTINITTSEKQLLKGIKVQDVNINKISPVHILNILEQLGIDKDRCNVVGVDLVHNIEPHDDTSFCKYQNYKKAVFVVTSMSSYRKVYADSPLDSFLYSDKQFTHLHKNTAFSFNPKKEHAVLVNGRVKGFVIFY